MKVTELKKHLTADFQDPFPLSPFQMLDQAGRKGTVNSGHPDAIKFTQQIKFILLNL